MNIVSGKLNMTSATAVVWENKLTSLSLVCLLLAAAYGVGAGAALAMNYDVTPNMGLVEDTLAGGQFVMFWLAALMGLAHLPMLLADLMDRLWRQAVVRAAALAGRCSGWACRSSHFCAGQRAGPCRSAHPVAHSGLTLPGRRLARRAISFLGFRR